MVPVGTAGIRLCIPSAGFAVVDVMSVARQGGHEAASNHDIRVSRMSIALRVDRRRFGRIRFGHRRRSPRLRLGRRPQTSNDATKGEFHAGIQRYRGLSEHVDHIVRFSAGHDAFVAGAPPAHGSDWPKEKATMRGLLPIPGEGRVIHVDVFVSYDGDPYWPNTEAIRAQRAGLGFMTNSCSRWSSSTAPLVPNPTRVATFAVNSL